MKTVFIYIILLIIGYAHTQNFSETELEIPPLHLGNAEFIDFDNDDDLDIFLHGFESGNPGGPHWAYIFQNNEGKYDSVYCSEFSTTSSFEWFDYDGDGYLDLTVFEDSGYLNIIEYQDNLFSKRKFSFARAKDTKWIDYDNDGDLDVFMIAGFGSEGFIYENKGNDEFKNVLKFPNKLMSRTDWGDYNNDGFIDVISIQAFDDRGYDNHVMLYQNSGDRTFVKYEIENITDTVGVIKFLILIMMGMKIYFGEEQVDPSTWWGMKTKLFRNEFGNGEFSNTDIVLNDGSFDGFFKGDFTNNGYYDFFISGHPESGIYSTTYNINNGDGSFFSGLYFELGIYAGDITGGDFDKDGDLDFLFIRAGNFVDDPKVSLFKNNTMKINTPPTSPTGVSSYTYLDEAHLFWDKAIDNESQSEVLTYNLRVGTSYYKDDVVASHTIPTTEKRNIVRDGNLGHTPFTYLKDLKKGKYYWQVQAIDPVFVPSYFSPVDSFEINYFAEFSTNNRSGSIPCAIVFLDSSSSGFNNWQWDFENDGIIDSNEENPIHTYFEADTFAVKLIVSNGVISDTLVKENYITTYIDTFPKLYKIEDIPNDQGGWVKVQFARSFYDTDSLILAKSNSVELYTIEIDDGSGWIAAATTGAYGKSLYQVLVPTTRDSSSESDGKIYFRIIASMHEGYFVSQVDSGYSVDNLIPAAPKGLIAKSGNSNVRLSWQPNSEDDFSYYTLYKSYEERDFVKIKKITDTVFVDNEIETNQQYIYALTSTDNSGNESSFSEIVSIVVTDLNDDNLIPSKYYLAQNYPNPFNPVTIIAYGIKKAGYIKLLIYDVLGNLVIELENDYKNAGNYKIQWNGLNGTGHAVSTGIYYYMIETNDFRSIKKMILIK